MKVKLLQNCVGHCLGEIVDLSDLQANRLLDKNRATRNLKYEIPQKDGERLFVPTLSTGITLPEADSETGHVAVGKKFKSKNTAKKKKKK